MKTSKLYRWAVVLTLLALVAEFVLGMYTALFVEFPDSLVQGNAWAFAFTGSPVIAAHIYLGTILILAGLITFALGIAEKQRGAILTSLLGLLLMLAAWLSGGAFLGNVQVNAYSFSMALTFLGSLLAYCAGLYFTRAPEKAG